MELVFRNNAEDKQWQAGFFEQVIRVAAVNCKLKNENFSISVNLINEEESQKLNKKYRSKDKPTDVLSFPLEIRNSKLEIPKPNVSTFDLGDIFICLSIAKKDAKEENIEIERKLAWLTVHGFLHLLGYDHERSLEEADKMANLEEDILNELGY